MLVLKPKYVNYIFFLSEWKGLTRWTCCNLPRWTLSFFVSRRFLFFYHSGFSFHSSILLFLLCSLYFVIIYNWYFVIMVGNFPRHRCKIPYWNQASYKSPFPLSIQFILEPTVRSKPINILNKDMTS